MLCLSFYLSSRVLDWCCFSPLRFNRTCTICSGCYSAIVKRHQTKGLILLECCCVLCSQSQWELNQVCTPDSNHKLWYPAANEGHMQSPLFCLQQQQHPAMQMQPEVAPGLPAHVQAPHQLCSHQGFRSHSRDITPMLMLNICTF